MEVIGVKENAEVCKESLPIFHFVPLLASRTIKYTECRGVCNVSVPLIRPR